MACAAIHLLLLAVGSFCLLGGSSARLEIFPMDLPIPMAKKFAEAEVVVPPLVDVNETKAILPPLVDVDVFSQPKLLARAGECSIPIRGGFSNPQPVYLKSNSEEFYPYTANGYMVVAGGQTLQMWCPSQFKSIKSQLLTAACVQGSTFRVNGNSYNIKELVCNSWPGLDAIRTGASCNGGIMIKVGFAIASNRFATEMEICFNEGEEVTRYVRHSLGPGSNYYQHGIDRLSFQTAGFFGGKNVDKLYSQRAQKDTIDRALGGNGPKYFDSSNNIFLARGHMGAKADFVYGTTQRATFLFINVAPQWQSFNAGNWASVEAGVRTWVSKGNKFVECYTGVWGVSTLPNSRGIQTPLYLSYDRNNNGLIPVPKIYFRVVIEPATRKGIVFVGINNPHLTSAEIQRDYIVCNDVSDRVSYVNWKKHDIVAGYSYACEVGEFTKKVTHLPPLSAPGGLLI